MFKFTEDKYFNKLIIRTIVISLLLAVSAALLKSFGASEQIMEIHMLVVGFFAFLLIVAVIKNAYKEIRHDMQNKNRKFFDNFLD